MEKIVSDHTKKRSKSIQILHGGSNQSGTGNSHKEWRSLKRSSRDFSNQASNKRMRTSEVVTLRMDDDSSDNDVEILEQRIKSRKTASLTRLVPSECRYVSTSSSWFLVRRNEKQESAYYLQISAWFGKYFFSLQVYLGRYMRSSSVTYLVRFLSTP